VRSLIEEAMTSSQLEGASTSRVRAKQMLREDRAPRDRSEQMILNNYSAMQRVIELRDERLTPELVCEIHRIVTDGTLDDPADAGRLQRPGELRVRIYGTQTEEQVLHVPPPAETLPERLETLCGFANDVDRSDGTVPYMPPLLRAPPQGWHFDRHRVQTEEEVFAEAATLDSFLKVHIRSGDDAHIRLLRLACPHRDELSRLEDTQQTCLRREGKFPYFVKEDRTARGFLEVSLAVGDSARERALQVTEELGVDGPLRDSPTVHSDIRAVLADTILMDDLREALLPDTALPDDQHRHIGGRHLHGRADSVVE